MPPTKVINRHECGIDLISWTFNSVRGTTGWTKSEILDIRHVQIVCDNTPRRNTNQFCGSIISSSVAGVVGLVTYALGNKKGIDLDLDIYLADGRVIEINITDKTLVKHLIPYMNAPNPREKYRKNRGI